MPSWRSLICCWTIRPIWRYLIMATKRHCNNQMIFNEMHYASDWSHLFVILISGIRLFIAVCITWHLQTVNVISWSRADEAWQAQNALDTKQIKCLTSEVEFWLGSLNDCPHCGDISNPTIENWENWRRGTFSIEKRINLIKATQCSWIWSKIHIAAGGQSVKFTRVIAQWIEPECVSVLCALLLFVKKK